MLDPKLCVPALRGIESEANFIEAALGPVLIVCKEAVYKATGTTVALQKLEVRYDTRLAAWTNAMVLELDDKTLRLETPGSVITPDGYLIGATFATTPSGAIFAFPLRDAFENFGLRFIQIPQLPFRRRRLLRSS